MRKRPLAFWGLAVVFLFAQVIISVVTAVLMAVAVVIAIYEITAPGASSDAVILAKLGADRLSGGATSLFILYHAPQRNATPNPKNITETEFTFFFYMDIFFLSFPL